MAIVHRAIVSATETLPGTVSGRPQKWRRVNRRSERRPDVVFSAVPQGSQRAARGSQWLESVRQHPEVVTMRADGRRNLLRTAAALLSGVRPSTMTTSPGWDYLLGQLNGSARRTLGRHLLRLRKLGLLGVVASGRTAVWTPKNSGQLINERSVYVLCVPRTLRSVDISGTPTVNGLRSNPQHAREQSEQTSYGPASPAENLSGSALEGAAASPQRNRPEHVCSLHATIAQATKRATRHAEKVAIGELLEHVPALRKARAAFLAWVCRPFFVAGWTPADVLHAIDHRPDDARIPHDGANGISDIARWVEHRLTVWNSPAGPLRSKSQRIDAEAIQRRAELRASAERRRREQAERAAGVYTPVMSWRDRLALVQAQQMATTPPGTGAVQQ